MLRSSLAVILLGSLPALAPANPAIPDRLGVDIYPDRPVSRPAEYRKSTLESTCVKIGGGNVIERAGAFNRCEYGAYEEGGKNYLLWEFNVKPGRENLASLVFNEKSDLIRVHPESIAFEVRNLGRESVTFYGVLSEFDWTPDPKDKFYAWHTKETETVLPGETKTLRLALDKLFPYGGIVPPSGREPVFPLYLQLLFRELKPDTDYKMAMRGLTIHTAPSNKTRAENAAGEVQSKGKGQTISYKALIKNKGGWHRAYLEIRRNPEVFWRVDVSENLEKLSAGNLDTVFEIPPLLPVGAYELGLAVDGLRVPGSEVSVRLGSDARPGFPEVRLEPCTGRPTIKINGTPFIWAGYASYEWQPGQMEDFGKAGANLFVVPCNAGRHMHQISPPLVAEPGRLDFGPTEEAILLSLSAQPEAKILLRISLALPPHLVRQIPDSIVKVRTPQGDIDWEETGSLVASYTSQEWRKKQGDLMRELLSFIEKQPCADHIIGVCLTSGPTEEWYAYGANDGEAYSDYSPVNQSAFAAWAKEKGFANTKIPEPKERPFTFKESDIFPDDENGRAATAYAAFMAESSANALLSFCREVKAATHNRLLTGSMYAYLLQLAGEPRQHMACNLNMGALLDAPEFDFFMGVPLHNFRKLVDGYDTFVTAVSSAQLHGKTYVNENDLFSWLHNGLWLTPYDPQDPRGAAIKMHQRVNASDVVNGNQSEWFGLFSNWHYDPDGRLLDAFRQINRIKIASVKLNREPCDEIAFLIDDTSYEWTTPGTRITDHQLPRFACALARTGAPLGLYLLSDIDRLPDRIKFAVVPWAPAMSPVTRKKLTAALRSGKRDLYLSGPIGLINTDTDTWRWDAQKMRTDFGLPIEVLGGTSEKNRKDGSHQMRITLPDGSSLTYDPKVETNPRMVWEGEGTVGFHTNDGRGTFGLQMAQGKSLWWSSVTVNDEGLLGKLIERAGVHRYAPEGFTVQASTGVVSVTAPKAGTATVSFPKDVTATDLYTGDCQSGREQNWTFTNGQTRLFELKSTPLPHPASSQ